MYAIARRGRGESDRTEGHGLEDEGRDVAAVIRSIDERVYLLGHSYGAQAAILAAGEAQDRVRKLVLSEAAWRTSSTLRPWRNWKRLHGPVIGTVSR